MPCIPADPSQYRDVSCFAGVDRAMIERIVNFNEEMLEERLLWDSILRRFIE